MAFYKMSDSEEQDAFLAQNTTPRPSYGLAYFLVFAGVIAQIGCFVADIYFSMTMTMTIYTFPIDLSFWMIINGLLGMGLTIAFLVYLCRPSEVTCLSYLFLSLTFFMMVWIILGWWSFGQSYAALSSNLVGFLWFRMILETIICCVSLLYITRYLTE